jgi:hypothetical protein
MRCVYCETPLPDAAMFCGECGNAVYPRDEVEPAVEGAAEPATEPGAMAEPGWEPQPEWEPESEPEGQPAAESGSRPEPTAESESRPAELSVPPVVVAVPEESTRFVDRRHDPVPFVLHFSTGETVTVAGSGLIGRRPTAQPGEYFDEYVAIDDPGRSVSKTHLEFGQDGGVLWISDRFSANGTVVREPQRSPRLCPSGRRTRVARGSRVDIGEQFFLVG